MHARHHDRIAIPVVAGVVLLWRLLALRFPSPLVAIDERLRLPLTLLGLLFLGCGLATWLARGGRWGRLAFAVGAAGGVHWGGAPGFGAEGLEALDLGLVVAYVGLSVISEAALLHLALVYPLGGHVTAPLRVGLYAPAAVAVLAAPFVAQIPGETLGTAVAALPQLATAFYLVALLIFLVQLARLHTEMRREARLVPLVAGLVVGGVVTLAAGLGLLPPPADAWNLAAVAMPLAVAGALITTPLDPPP